MATYLFKTEPTEYAFADLVRDGRTVWAGVSNPAALTHLRACRDGDEVFIYHTGTERAIVGLGRVLRGAYADPARPGLTPTGEPKFAVVDLAPVAAASEPVSLARFKADRRFSEFPLVNQGRLSVMPVPAGLAKIVRSWSGW